MAITGSNTLSNLARAPSNAKRPEDRILHLPHLEAWGAWANITPIEGVPARWSGKGEGAFGRAVELSLGKDTTAGHWEMAGLVVRKPFTTYPARLFKREVVDRWCRENDLPGVLGNKVVASGTQIIDELGLRTPAHRQTHPLARAPTAFGKWPRTKKSFGLDRLYAICKSARKICDDLQISRVIARPFVGDPSQGHPLQETHLPPQGLRAASVCARTYLDRSPGSQGVPVLWASARSPTSTAGQGITENI